MTVDRNEILDLAGQWCDERLSTADGKRLESLLRESDDAVGWFVEYVQLHGQLQWEGGWAPMLPAGSHSDEEITLDSSPRPRPAAKTRGADQQTARRVISAIAVAGLLIAVIAWGAGRLWQPVDQNIAESDTPTGRTSDGSMTVDPDAADRGGDLPPIRLNNLTARTIPDPVNNRDPVPETGNDGSTIAVPDRTQTDIVTRIDDLLQRSWTENEVVPANVAGDEEWVRRAYVTFTGRIPTLSEVRSFVESDSPRKRGQLVDSLLNDHRTAESLAVVWTNLLIGRSASPDLDAGALYGFLEDQFRDNRPWMETVTRLLAAEGRSDEVGETNFLLAHLNSAATPATAVVSRLFLCEQMHCMQCHDHPSISSREQEQFWELNAFFKQAQREPILVSLENGEQQRVWKLEESERGGMTFFENRRGQQLAVLPKFDGRKLSADPSERRREALAEFLQADSDQRVARAMVNRMWAHFFGAGFTNPVDDMGPHNPPTHPELLDLLTEAFVQSNYDLQQLMRWIAMSDAWQRSSVAPEDDPDLDPLRGGTPVFAQVYPRHMTPEEVYESIRVAIRSVGRQPLDSSVGSEHRREWVGQFVRSLENDENEEALSFEGDVSQALLMMNGQETEKALPLTIDAMLNAPDGPGRSAGEALKQLSLATVAREPTESEDRVFRNRYRMLSRTMSQRDSLALALEDMLWAYLNSSEFVTVH